MTVLYRGRHALVTQDAIATDDTGWRRIAIADLRRIHIVRSGGGGPAAGHRAFATSTLLVALVAIPVVGRTAVLLAVGLAVVTIAAAIVRRGRHHVHWELAAHHRGTPVLLFGSTDQREFDQVCRAVRRALEHLEPG